MTEGKKPGPIRVRNLGEIDLAAGAILDQIKLQVCDGSKTILVGFIGSLAAGKTTLIRRILGLAGFKGVVNSPSYTLCHEYKLNTDILYEHWDLYRISSAPEELLTQGHGATVRLIEWPDRCEDLMVALDLIVHVRLAEESVEGCEERVVEVSFQPLV